MDFGESGSFPPFFAFGTPDAIPLAWSPNGSETKSGRPKMTLTFAKIPQIAFSIVGALFASSLFLSAALGPVPVV